MPQEQPQKRRKDKNKQNKKQKKPRPRKQTPPFITHTHTHTRDPTTQHHMKIPPAQSVRHDAALKGNGPKGPKPGSVWTETKPWAAFQFSLPGCESFSSKGRGLAFVFLSRHPPSTLRLGGSCKMAGSGSVSKPHSFTRQTLRSFCWAQW